MECEGGQVSSVHVRIQPHIRNLTGWGASMCLHYSEGEGGCRREKGVWKGEGVKAGAKSRSYVDLCTLLLLK